MQRLFIEKSRKKIPAGRRKSMVTGLSVLSLALALTACAGSDTNPSGAAPPDREPTTSTMNTSSTAPSTSMTTSKPAESPTTSVKPSETDCGPVQTVEPNQKLIAIRGVTCETAKSVLKQWDQFSANGASAPDGGWGCYMGRQGDGYNLVCATAFPEGTSAKATAKNVFVLLDR